MEDDVVGRVLEAAQRLALGVVGIVQQRQRDVRVRGHDDRVIALAVPALRGDDRATLIAAHLGDGVAAPDGPLGQPLDDALDVLHRAAHDGAPGMALPEADEAVVVEEAQQVVDREVHDLGRRRGPDRRDDGDEEVVAEAVAVATLFEEGTQGVPGPGALIEAAAGDGIEAADVGDHAPVSRSHEAVRLGEDARGPERAELEAARAAGVAQ